MDKNSQLYAINKDLCPDNDAIIMKELCRDCKHYKGFDMYFGQPCIYCSFNETHDDKDNQA